MSAGPSPVPALVSRVRAPLRVPRPRPGGGGAFEHGPLARVIAATSDGWTVDYLAVGASEELAVYLEALATADPAALDAGGQMAFWINAYNASVLAAVAARWPVATVFDIPGIFTSLRLRVGGRTLTLDDIEHGIARRLGDPRVHFGLNCGSVGCPPLRAYGEDVVAELDANGRRYLADERRGARADGELLLLSRIFQWFGGDFLTGMRAPSAAATIVAALRPARVLPAVRPYLPRPLAGLERVGFLDYDWSVNGRS